MRINNHGILDITQCTSFSGVTGNCNTSTMAISNLDWGNMVGTAVSGVTRLATLGCSAAAPCENITVSDMDVTAGGKKITRISCTAVQGSTGFGC
jgi:hypothetical protein